LRENRALNINPVAAENFSDKLRWKFLVLSRQRIDGRIEEILGIGSWRENSGEENIAASWRERFLRKFHSAIGRKDRWEAPDPAIAQACGINQGRRLWVMDHHEFRVREELRGFARCNRNISKSSALHDKERRAALWKSWSLKNPRPRSSRPI
jgi:hypothetical protein